MRHVILGAGGIGGLLAGALAQANEDVTLLMRRESVAFYPGTLRVASVVLGDFEIAVPAVAELAPPVDVLWIAVKATGLEDAIALAPPELVGDAVVVPLLNGVDHLDALRQRYRHVVAAAIRVESERTAPGVIVQKSPFIRVDMVGAAHVLDVLRHAGIECAAQTDERTLLWEKLAFLAPVALSSTAFDAPLGVIREEALFTGCVAETVTAAEAAGAIVDERALWNAYATFPADMESSMQKDVAAGRDPELAAIAGPILRLGREHGFSTAATAELVARIRGRLNA